jgi:hypothetical protein
MITDVPIGTVVRLLLLCINMRILERVVLFIPLVSSNGVAMTSMIVPLRLTVVDNNSLHQTVMSFPSMSGMVCHTSRCAPLHTRNSKSSHTSLDE